MHGAFFLMNFTTQVQILILTPQTPRREAQACLDLKLTEFSAISLLAISPELSKMRIEGWPVPPWCFKFS